MNTIIHYVYNTRADVLAYAAIFADAYKTGVLSEDFADLFSITILKGHNPDGTDRMVIADA